MKLLKRTTAFSALSFLSLGIAAADESAEYPGTITAGFDGENGFRIAADMTLSFEELSVVNYRYGGSVDLSFDTEAADPDILVDSFEVHVGISNFDLQVSSDLTISFAPETDLALGEGLFGQGTKLQPISGADGYEGFYTDAAGEGEFGYKLSADWERFGINLAIDEDGLLEAAMVLKTDLVDASIARTSGTGQATGYVYGLDFDFGLTSLAITHGKTSSLGRSTTGLSLSREFQAMTLSFSHGRDKGGAATGFSDATALAADIFIGDAGMLSLGFGLYDDVNTGSGDNLFASYRHQFQAVELVASYGKISGGNSENLAELGVIYTF